MDYADLVKKAQDEAVQQLLARFLVLSPDELCPQASQSIDEVLATARKSFAEVDNFDKSKIMPRRVALLRQKRLDSARQVAMYGLTTFKVSPATAQLIVNMLEKEAGS